ncbi:zinc finger protein 782-like [Ornithodoros turicata]|uniref:zinc finger protein 782-like n=1 Tax=Ornithodoros turicata TaxID=34597 RepID=UPI003138A158
MQKMCALLSPTQKDGSSAGIRLLEVKSEPNDTTSYEEMGSSGSVPSPQSSDLGVAKLSDLVRERPFKCRVCSATFLQNSHLRAHLNTHTGKVFLCGICDAPFTNRFSVKRHMKRYGGDCLHTCKMCSTTFSKVLLKCHVCPSGEKLHECELCDASFTERGDLKRHVQTHAEARRHKCEHCPATFRYASSLKRHMYTHAAEKPHQCTLCPATFIYASALQRHMLTHTGGKPHKCERCGATFADCSTLKRHTRAHTGEKPFECELCPASFTRPQELKMHERTHSGERPYKCSLCDASFSLSGVLRRHIRTHTGEKPYKCELCSTHFSSKCNFRRHTQRKHCKSGLRECEFCHAKFRGLQQYTYHMYTHALKDGSPKRPAQDLQSGGGTGYILLCPLVAVSVPAQDVCSSEVLGV